MMRAIAELLFPIGCAACRRPVGEELFCSGCLALVEALPDWHCRLCCGNLPPPIRRGEAAGLCSGCQAERPAFDGVWAPFVYGGAVAKAIHRLKYRGERGLAARLAGPMIESGREALAVVDLIAHVPLHPSRRQVRGFDQALLLAKALAKGVGGAQAKNALRRLNPAGRQVGRGREERSAAMVGAFRAGSGVRGASFLLVDDVVTSGATANAAARALKQAGARQVFVLAAARAI